MLRYQNGTVTADSLLLDTPYAISSFGVDQNNELYICNHNGSILRFAGGLSTAVDEQAGKSPTQGSLMQNFPNPFNPSTRIRYAVPFSGAVTLSLFNVVGQEVAVLFDGVHIAGVHEVEFRNPGLSSGVYFYRLWAPGLLETGKMLIAR